MIISEDELKDIIDVTSHFSQSDIKGLQYLYYAQYQIVYQSFQMKHAAYLQKKHIVMSKKQQKELISKKYQKLLQKVKSKLISIDISSIRLLNRLQSLYNDVEIPKFHRYYFLNLVSTCLSHPIQIINKFFQNQQKLISNQTHIIFSINKAIKARQICLRQVEGLLAILRQFDVEDYLDRSKQRVLYHTKRKQRHQYHIQGYKINKYFDHQVHKNVFQLTKLQLFGISCRHLFKLSIHVISLIFKWKQYLYSLSSSQIKSYDQIDYYYDDDHYILKLIDDNRFIQKSFLGKYYTFAKKNDPFLFKPLLTLQSQQQQVNKLASSIDQNIQFSYQKKALMKIFSPQSQNQLLQRLSSLRLLISQFQTNIKNRKSYDLRTMSKINKLDFGDLAQYKINQINDPRQYSIKRKQSGSKSFKISPVRSKSTNNLPQLNNNVLIKNNSFKQTLQSQINSPKKLNDLKLTTKQSYNQNFLKQNPKQSILKKTLISQHSKSITSNLMDFNQLKTIKDQIKDKIIQEFKLKEKNKSFLIFQQPQLANYVQNQVKLLLQKRYLDNQVQSTINLRNNNQTNQNITQLCVQTYSIEQNQLTSHIKYLYQKQSILAYSFLQVPLQNLVQNNHTQQSIQKLACVHFLKVTQKPHLNQTHLNQTSSKPKILSNIILSPKYKPSDKLSNSNNHKLQKVIQIIYMTIKDQSVFMLQRIILKVVQFLFKYQTANIIQFTFYYHQNHQVQTHLLKQIKTIFSMQDCIVLQTKFKLNFNQVKFHFTRNIKSKAQQSHKHNRFYNKNSLNSMSFCLSLDCIKSTQKLNKQNDKQSFINKQKEDNSILKNINYDYLLSQILKNHVSSQQILRLNSSNQKDRLQIIIKNIQSFHNKENLPFIKTQIFSNLTELNKKKSIQQKRIYDFKFDNQILLFQMQFLMSLPYKSKIFIGYDGNGYSRFQINSDIQVHDIKFLSAFNQNIIHKSTKIYLFPLKQKRNIKIGFFQADQMMSFIDGQNKLIRQKQVNGRQIGLSDIINTCSFTKNLQKVGKTSSYLLDSFLQPLRYLFLPMLYPKTQPNLIKPLKSKDLSLLNQQLFIGQYFQWGYDLFLENGIRYHCQEQKNDLKFQLATNNNGKKKRFGILLLLLPENVILYSKIF